MKSTKPVTIERNQPRTIHQTLLSVLAVALGLLIADHAQASTKISSCPYTITAPGVYVVTQDLTCAGTAITILASKVDLNLGGHTISGSGTGDGIYVQGQSNVRIHQGTVQGFENGVELQHTLECKITNLTVTQNSAFGISGQGGTVGLTVTGCTASQNGAHGILFGSDSRGNTIEHNTANQNGFAGIFIGNGPFANTVTANTANLNGFVGIWLEATVANNVTDNTTTLNGDRGISLLFASGNTVARNTTDRNGSSGIDIDGDSHGNTVVRNSATANGDGGIRLLDVPTQNTVQDNTVSGSFRGIWLSAGGSGLGAGATSNSIQGNTVTLNVLGIWIEQGSTGNNIQGNTALSNRDFDLGDQNPGCDSNTWTNNDFVTDNVAGASDLGSDAGCIQ